MDDAKAAPPWDLGAKQQQGVTMSKTVEIQTIDSEPLHSIAMEDGAIAMEC